MIAIKSGGLCCGCGGGGETCPIHLTTPLGYWEVRADGEPQAIPAFATYSYGLPIPGKLTAQDGREWVAYGEKAPPVSGSLLAAPITMRPILSASEAGVYGVTFDEEQEQALSTPSWDTPSTYTINALSVSGGTASGTVGSSRVRVYNGLRSAPTAASWADFFAVSPGVSFPIGEGTVPAPMDNGQALPIGADPTASVNIGVSLPGDPGYFGQVRLRLRLDLQQIVLDSYTLPAIAGGVSTAGGSLDAPGFPVSLASDDVQTAHAYSVGYTIRDSGGVALLTGTLAGSITRTAWGVISAAPGTEAFSCPVGRLYNLAPGALIPFLAREELVTRTFPTGAAGQTTLSTNLTLSLSPAATPFPNAVLTDAIAGTFAADGEPVIVNKTLTVSPKYKDLEINGANLGTGRAGTSSTGNWSITATVPADIDLTSRFSGYDSVIMPADTVLPVNVQTFSNGNATLRQGPSAAFSGVTLNTVTGGVPGTLTVSGSALSFSPSNTAISSSMSMAFSLLMTGASFSTATYSLTIGNVAALTQSNASAVVPFEIIAQACAPDTSGGSGGLSRLRANIAATGAPTVGGNAATYAPEDVTPRPVASFEVFPLICRLVGEEQTGTLILSGSSFLLQAGANGGVQAWGAIADHDQTLITDFDVTKIYGPIRSFEFGCPVPAPENARITANVSGSGVTQFEADSAATAAGPAATSISLFHDESGSTFNATLAFRFCDSVTWFELISGDALNRPLSEWPHAQPMSAPISASPRRGYNATGTEIFGPAVALTGTLTITCPGVPAL